MCLNEMLTCAVGATGARVDGSAAAVAGGGAFSARRGGAARGRTERLHDALAFRMGRRWEEEEADPRAAAGLRVP